MLELVKDLPPWRKAIKDKWVFSVNLKPDKSIEKFKARYVCCGYSQIAGIDCEEPFCSILHQESLHVICAAACAADDDMLKIDIVKAFPPGEWDGTEHYLQQAPGFVNKNFVACKLLRPLEGTKQAGNLWKKSNAATLTKIGLQRCEVEPNLWKLVDPSGVNFHIALYVDNILIRYPKGTRAILDKSFIKPYTAVYKCTILGEPTKLVGIELSCDRVARTIDLKQTRYIETIHAKFCSARTTKDFTIPIPASGIDTFHAMQPAETDAEKDSLGSRSVLELFDLLLWATATHLEICLYMSFLCRFIHKLKLEHYETSLAVLSYRCP